jgi:hypothetical protein
MRFLCFFLLMRGPFTRTFLIIEKLGFGVCSPYNRVLLRFCEAYRRDEYEKSNKI